MRLKALAQIGNFLADVYENNTKRFNIAWSPVALVGRVGEYERRKAIMKRLKDEGADTEYVIEDGVDQSARILSPKPLQTFSWCHS